MNSISTILVTRRNIQTQTSAGKTVVLR